MKKTIHRRLEFTSQDIKEAVLALLAERDQPYPGKDARDESFIMTEGGAELSWSETVG